MKIICLSAGLLSLMVLGSGCVVTTDQYGRAVLQPMLMFPVVTTTTPTVPVEEATVDVDVAVPDSYVMVDGEYVGVVGDQYMYLGPGGVWFACDPYRLERFHRWEGTHRDWREHSIHNDRFHSSRANGGHDARIHQEQHGQPGHRESTEPTQRTESPKNAAGSARKSAPQKAAPSKKQEDKH